jgi:hypothetical protein
MFDYAIEDNETLGEDVDMALDPLNKLPEHNNHDKTMLVIVLQKIELLDKLF